MIKISTRADLKRWKKQDAARNGINSWLKYRILLFLRSENACVVDYLRTLRTLEYHLNNSGNILHKIMSKILKARLSRKGFKYNLRIWPNCTGPGLRIPHIVGGVIINCKSMGCNCGVNCGVVIGNKDSQENRPIIGNNVGFMVGSKVFGKVTIGNNVKIAPGAIVTKDIPDNSIVAGIPAKILRTINA